MKIFSTFLIVFLYIVCLSHFSCESSEDIKFDKEQKLEYNSTEILFDTITNLSLNIDNDLENDELFGQVKSLKKVDSSLNKLEPTYDDYNYIYFYKENGNYDSTILFYEDNSLFLRLNYFYLENRLTHIDFLDEFSKTTNFYIYDKQGNNYIIYSVVDTIVESITNYIYNKKNQLVEVRDEFETELEYTTSKFRYFENGLLEKDKYYSQDGELFDYSTYEYNDKGENDKMSTYNSKGEITNIWHYKYDNYGNVIAVENYNPQGKIIDKYSYHYVYDLKGNWVSKKTYQYYIPTMITTREITYY